MSSGPRLSPSLQAPPTAAVVVDPCEVLPAVVVDPCARRRHRHGSAARDTPCLSWIRGGKDATIGFAAAPPVATAKGGMPRSRKLVDPEEEVLGERKWIWKAGERKRKEVVGICGVQLNAYYSSI